MAGRWLRKLDLPNLRLCFEYPRLENRSPLALVPLGCKDRVQVRGSANLAVYTANLATLRTRCLALAVHEGIAVQT